MEAEAARDFVRHLNDELVCRGNLAIVDELFLADFVSHTSGDDVDRGGFKRMLASLRAALPNVQVATELVLADGDLVAWRSVTRGTHAGEWLGVPATGRRVEWASIHIGRLRDGRFAEHWGSPDLLGLLTQLGEVTRPA